MIKVEVGVKTLKFVGRTDSKTADRFCTEHIFFREKPEPDSWLVSIVPIPPVGSFEFWKAFHRVNCKPTIVDALAVFGESERITGVLSLDCLSTPVLSYAGAGGILTSENKNVSHQLLRFIGLLCRISALENDAACTRINAAQNLDLGEIELDPKAFEKFLTWFRNDMPGSYPSEILVSNFL
jgi:hypothetical protein